MHLAKFEILLNFGCNLLINQITKQTGNLIDLATLNTKTYVAEWSSFSREAAITHLFMHITTDPEAEKIAHQILQDNPEGDFEKLVQELNIPDRAPWKEKDH